MIIERAITLMQPWATLVAIGSKAVETRSWPTKYRGWVAIHASKAFPIYCRELATFVEPYKSELANAGYAHWHQLPRGAVVAVAEITDCLPSEVCAKWISPQENEFGTFGEGRYGFVLSNVRRLRTPLEVSGALGIWRFGGPRRITEEDLLDAP